jgi:hypothetical protein
MKKFDSYEENKKTAKEEGSFTKLTTGQYPSQILKVSDIVDKEYLLIEFDIIYPEEFKDYFKKQQEQFGGDWPSQGLMYWSYKDTAQDFFTRKMVAIEKSNDNFKWNWDESKLKGKKFVANFGEEEYELEGELKVSLKCREVRSTTSYKEGKVKDLAYKGLNGNTKPEAPQEEATSIPSDPNLPF